ncbi:MAG: ATP-dependent sacrificial sulfur transferase LarE [Coriobacteriia bacterium]|nr:ATP-dependent sacrificial sulfur transferase LarE [Coriobacteriia bacterium]
MEATAEQKYDALCEHLAGLDSLLVAYSGGVDSTLLAVAAHSVLGDRTVAVLARSDTYPESDAVAAAALARELGLHLLEIDTHELSDPRFHSNPPDRCYYCKLELFGLLRTVADTRGLTALADGSNADDADDHRPGRRAAAEFGVISPLAAAGMTKADIRRIASLLGLPNHDKPSMACLASRFPYGSTIDDEALRRVARAEDALRSMGLRQFRVRSHGDVARVEIDPTEMDAAWARRTEISSAVRLAGFAYVAADLDGYRSGSLNETLDVLETAEPLTPPSP